MNVGWKFEGLLFRITLRSLGRGKDIKLHFENEEFLKIKIATRKTDLWREKSKKWYTIIQIIQANKKSSKYGELKWRDMYWTLKLETLPTKFRWDYNVKKGFITYNMVPGQFSAASKFWCKSKYLYYYFIFLQSGFIESQLCARKFYILTEILILNFFTL